MQPINKKELESQKNVFTHESFSEQQDCTVEGASTLHELFIKTVKRFQDKEFLGTISGDKIGYISYLKAYNISRNYAKQLKPLMEDGDRIGIISVNREEWFVSEQAIYANNGVICPLYATMGNPSVAHIIREAELKVIYASSMGVLKLKEVLKSADLEINTILSYDPFEQDVEEYFKGRGVSLQLVTDSEEEYPVQFISSSKAEDISTICYTSGTTGNPKGAILTHKCFMSQIKVLSNPSNDFFRINADDVYMSYLPLAHVMERICTQAVIYFGGKIGVYSGDPKNLAVDLKIVQPSFIAAVPRVFNIFKEKIVEKIKKRNFIIRFLFRFALKYKINRQKSGKYSSRFFDFLIFKRIHKEFGGNLKHALSGSAPLNPEVCEFMQAVFSMKICEGYGSTEATAANILKPLNCHECGTVGLPFPSNKIKLVRSKKFKHENEGEIYIKGENVFKGYIHKDKETSETLFDGWVKTGDIGRVNNGLFEIVGRDKEIFKLSIGEYIIPDKLEKIYANCVDDIFITTSEFGDHIVAIVVSKESEEEILSKISARGEKEFLKGTISRYEIPRKIFVTNEDFMSSGLLTPTNKKIRAKIQEKYLPEISKLSLKEQTNI